jgi:hypothetical protein
VQRVGEAWIKGYPAHLGTSEGIALRFELASSYQREGFGYPKADPDARTPLRKALRLFDDLGETDFAELAKENRTKIMARLVE